MLTLLAGFLCIAFLDQACARNPLHLFAPFFSVLSNKFLVNLVEMEHYIKRVDKSVNTSYGFNHHGIGQFQKKKAVFPLHPGFFSTFA
ncbi:hypothetical protein CW304_21860 [Bacillus sp. UFRGS-B20]|nr:hypothetical protein CW304_21860 [Bacillus sp. UFRGS-B20]